MLGVESPTQTPENVPITICANLLANRNVSLDSLIGFAHRVVVSRSNSTPSELMNSSIRTIIASLLCGVAVLGHAPAWVHLADCDHGAHEASLHEASAPVEETCPFGCQHHADDDAAESPQGDSDGHHHDSDSCVICQSLAAPTGVTWQIESNLSSEACCEFVQVLSILETRSNFQSIPQPRGPPVSA